MLLISYIVNDELTFDSSVYSRTVIIIIIMIIIIIIICL